MRNVDACILCRWTTHSCMVKESMNSNTDSRLVRETKAIVEVAFRNGPIEDLHTAFYFYAAYGPTLKWLNHSAATAWLSAFCSRTRFSLPAHSWNSFARTWVALPPGSDCSLSWRFRSMAPPLAHPAGYHAIPCHDAQHQRCSCAASEQTEPPPGCGFGGCHVTRQYSRANRTRRIQN